jgi:hypothetical protein
MEFEKKMVYIPQGNGCMLFNYLKEGEPRIDNTFMIIGV